MTGGVGDVDYICTLVLSFLYLLLFLKGLLALSEWICQEWKLQSECNKVSALKCLPTPEQAPPAAHISAFHSTAPAMPDNPASFSASALNMGWLCQGRQLVSLAPSDVGVTRSMSTA